MDDDIIEYVPPHLRGVKLMLPKPLVPSAPATANNRYQPPANKQQENRRHQQTRAPSNASTEQLLPSAYPAPTFKSSEPQWKKKGPSSTASTAAPSVAPLLEPSYRALSTYSEATTEYAESEHPWENGNRQTTQKPNPWRSGNPSTTAKPTGASPSTPPASKVNQRAPSLASTDLLPPIEKKLREGVKAGSLAGSVVFPSPGSTQSKLRASSREEDNKAHIERVREAIIKAEAERGQPKKKGPAGPKTIKPFPCIFDDCDEEYDNKVDLKKHMDEIHERCEMCKEDFRNHDELLMHKLASPRHIACPHCAEDFNTSRGRDRHVRQTHLREQSIICPGCSEKFTRAGALLDHIEKNLCSTYSAVQLEMNRAMGVSHITQFFSADPDTEAPPASRRSQSGTVKTNKEDVDLISHMSNVAEEAGEEAFEQAFPALGSGISLKNVALMQKTGATESLIDLEDPKPKKLFGAPSSVSGSVWSYAGAQRVPQAPSVRTWVPETNSNSKWNPDKFGDQDMPNLEKLSVGNGVKISAKMLTDANGVSLDTTSAEFNVEKFKNSLGRYACPHPQCGKSFISMADFKSHLDSPAHRGVDHRCPGCLKIFKSATAITQHLESPSTRCKVQSLSVFQQTVTLVSGGFLDATQIGDTEIPKFTAEAPKW